MPGDTAPDPLTGSYRAVTVFEKGLSNMADMLSLERPHEPPQQSAHLTRFTVADVMRLAGAGVLRDDRRYELINGLIYEIHVPGPNHQYLVNKIAFLFTRLFIERGVDPEQLVMQEKPLYFQRRPTGCRT